MADIKEILIENAQEYYGEAVSAEKSNHYNSSCSLYFKALFSLLDLYILVEEGFVPSNHAERFRILEVKHPEKYKIIDELFPLYRDSYKSKLNKETCKVIRTNVEKLFKDIKISF